SDRDTRDRARHGKTLGGGWRAQGKPHGSLQPDLRSQSHRRCRRREIPGDIRESPEGPFMAPELVAGRPNCPRFGLVTSSSPTHDIVQSGILAEKYSFDSLWIPDHFTDLYPTGDKVDPWTVF